jgi:putative membrane protein
MAASPAGPLEHLKLAAVSGDLHSARTFRMNRTLLVAALASLLVSGAACAQDAANNASPNPAAVASAHTDSKTAAAPVPGKNSFTKKQAAKRLRDHGYSAVKGLTKDDEGIWHGTATKDGSPVHVSLDYQGNIAEQ